MKNNQRKFSRDDAVKINANGEDWYYQSAKDGDGIELYDSLGRYVRTFLDFDDMMYGIDGKDWPKHTEQLIGRVN